MSNIPQADRINGLPHPNETERLYGHDSAITQVLEAVNRDRIHHAWMLTGPKGIGKATLSYHIARFLLAQELPGDSFVGTPSSSTSLEVGQDHPVASRIRAGSEPGLCVLRRPIDEKTGKLKTVITVDTLRELHKFFSLSAGGNGRRIVIVDCIDDMNSNAANALLKVLEEPPVGAVLLLVTHQHSRILPTIRSRCRTLSCSTLSPENLQKATEIALPGHAFNTGIITLAEGSVGQAAEIALTGGLENYATIIDICSSLPRFDRTKLLRLANSIDPGTGGRFDQILNLLDIFISRLARSAVSPVSIHEAVVGESAVFGKLCPNQNAARLWANTQLELSQRARQGKTANLDPSSLILDMGLRIEETALKILS